MWDTRETNFNIMNTPYGKDVLGMLAEECHKRNFPLVLTIPAWTGTSRHIRISAGIMKS